MSLDSKELVEISEKPLHHEFKFKGVGDFLSTAKENCSEYQFQNICKRRQFTQSVSYLTSDPGDR